MFLLTELETRPLPPISYQPTGRFASVQSLQEQLVYLYDAAGNLSARTNYQFVQSFGVNSLNELTSGSRVGTLTVAGTSSTNASSVSVNTTNASRYLDATFAAVGFTVTNGNNTFTAVASDSLGRSASSSVSVNLPSSPSFTYDANGNMTSDGNLGYEYDDENQLIRVTATNTWKSAFVYDGKMRLRIRYESNYVGSSWVKASETRYIYDGMLVVQERDLDNVPMVTYVRGADLSGTRTGAGGIGGLLARIDNSLLNVGASGAYACYHADANGNVTAMVSDKQAVVAKYSYDPYGNSLGEVGPLASVNKYRFSSKELHKTSGLYYYGYRFYTPNLQRWLNRDPIGEQGGVNLYDSFYNSPVSVSDPLGLEGLIVEPLPSSPTIPGIGKPIIPGPAGWAICVAWAFGKCVEWYPLPPPDPLPLPPNKQKRPFPTPGPISCNIGHEPHPQAPRPFPSGGQTREECRATCDKNHDLDSERCRDKATPAEQRRCLEAAFDKYSSCLADCNQIPK